jgi:putative ABC transport system ATP-binding protein/lipoprotein-releasing system ATP-binding protein
VAHIQLTTLSKNYIVDDTEIVAVNNVTLSIEQGEFLSIVGHSGSGKTTLISMIGGILRPSSGKIMLEGEDICLLNDDQLSEYRNGKIGFIFQFASLLPILTNKENVLLPGLFSPGYNAVSEQKAEEYLELVGLKDKMDAYPAQLSGGQQRRVAIARALVNDPAIILADEPTGDLDEDTEAEMMDMFRAINRDKRVTMILITHNLELAQNASKQLRMTQGELLEL